MDHPPRRTRQTEVERLGPHGFVVGAVAGVAGGQCACGSCAGGPVSRKTGDVQVQVGGWRFGEEALDGVPHIGEGRCCSAVRRQEGTLGVSEVHDAWQGRRELALARSQALASDYPVPAVLEGDRNPAEPVVPSAAHILADACHVVVVLDRHRTWPSLAALFPETPYPAHDAPSPAFPFHVAPYPA